MAVREKIFPSGVLVSVIDDGHNFSEIHIFHRNKQHHVFGQEICNDLIDIFMAFGYLVIRREYSHLRLLHGLLF